MTKATLLVYCHQNDHHLIQDLSLEDMYDRHHPYDINEIAVPAGSKYLINDQLQISVFQGGIVSLVMDLWKSSFAINMFINGSTTWKNSDNRIIPLDVNDILEVSWHDTLKDILFHRLIIISKISS